MTAFVQLTKDGKFEGLIDADGKLIPWIPIEGHGRKQNAKKPPSDQDSSEEGEEDSSDEEELWYPDEEVPVEMLNLQNNCNHCGALEPEDKWLKCSACKENIYCSSECFDTDWDELHQHECQLEMSAEAIECLNISYNMPEDDEAPEAVVGNEVTVGRFDEDIDIGQTPTRRARPGRRGGSVPSRRTRSGPGGRSRPSGRTRRGATAPPARRNTAPGALPRRSTRREPFQRGTRYTRAPRGRYSGSRRWARNYRNRRWYRPGLYGWYSRWYPSYRYSWVTALLAPFRPRGPRVDPLWYFDPINDSPEDVDRQLRILRRQHYYRGYTLVPDYDVGRFRWIRRRGRGLFGLFSEVPQTTVACHTGKSKGVVQKEPSIVEIVVMNPNFDNLENFVKTAGLVETLASPGPFTVFAPTDEAWSNLDDDRMSKLMSDPELLKYALLYHVVPGYFTAADLLGMESGELTTANGRTLSFVADESSGTVELTTGDDISVKITQTDITAINGIIHVIDTVMLL